MKNKLKILLLSVVAATSLSGCGKEKENVTSKSVDIVNLSSDYLISSKKTTVFYLNNDQSTPYVDVQTFTKDFDGYFKNSSIHYYKDLFKKSLKLQSSGCVASFNWEDDEIVVGDMDLFYYIVNESSTTNYSSYLKLFDYGFSGKEKVNFKLHNYGYKVHKTNNEILIPLFVANILFCSPNYLNLFYKNDKIYCFCGEIYTSDPEYQTIYKTPIEGNNEALRESTINSLCFTMDYFYGLKEDKNITSFRDYIPNDLMNGLKSSSAIENAQALKNLLVTKLDDLHTRIDSVSFYHSDPTVNPYTRNDLGTFGKSYYSTRDYLSNLRTQNFPGGLYAVRYYGDTAIITLNSFMTGTNDQIFDSLGNVKEDAWKYDSYWFMKMCMDSISNHPEVNDVLLDLSLNGGGNLGALIRVYGFLTDDYYYDYGYDTLTKEKTVYKYLIDSDRDGYYQDHDSFDNYRWTILSGINTFSAANALITKVKQTGVAKMIGQKSGGGMCSVLPTILQDGTAICISSQNTIRYLNNEVLESTEFGHEVCVKFDYDDFYNDEKLVNYIDQAYNL